VALLQPFSPRQQQRLCYLSLSAQCTQSFQSTTRMVINAGPINNPTSPNVSAPPRIPNSTSKNGNLAAPPINTGLTACSATNTTTNPNTAPQPAATIEPCAANHNAAPMNTIGAQNGSIAAMAVSMPSKV